MGVASIVRLQKAELYFADGKLEASLREARRVADAFAEQEALPQLARAALLQARITAKLGDTTSAQYLCQQALDIAQGQDLLDLKYRCDYLLGPIAEDHGDLPAAAHYHYHAIHRLDILQQHRLIHE